MMNDTLIGKEGGEWMLQKYKEIKQRCDKRSDNC